VSLEPKFAAAMPEVLLGLGPDAFAALAAKAMTPKPVPVVGLDHIHASKVSVREHAAILRERLARLGQASFRALCSDCTTTLEIIARFLALLELFREGVLSFDQIEPLGELHVRWVGGGSESPPVVIDEYGSDADTPLGAVPGSRAAPEIETKGQE
jgi:segregation and condensation protein A